MPIPTNDLLQTLKTTKDTYEPRLLIKQNVNGIGLGLKQRQGKLTDEPCVQVFVEQKFKDRDLAREDLIPANIDGIATDVVEVGKIKAQALTAKIRPAKPGFSIGHFAITAGTFGCIVRDTVYPGLYFILSNNHVLANSNAAKKGDRILQPGPLDGGVKYANTIAKLSRYVPIKFGKKDYNLVDAAIAKPLNMDLVIGSIYQLGIPKGTQEATLGMLVTKTGRTTETTTGKVISIDATVAVNYRAGRVAYFRNQFLTTDMSSGGDSGSVVLNKTNHKAVGLLFAGSSRVTVCNNIHNVMMALNISLLTE